MTLRETLLILSDAYVVASGRTRSTLSTVAFGGGRVLERIEDGGDITTGNFERALQWFSDNWPADTAWPDGIDRPVAAAKSEHAA
jgi:hypothetical protein